MADPITVLAVDDQPRKLRLLDAVLSPGGCRVITAASGEEAVELLTFCCTSAPPRGIRWIPSHTSGGVWEEYDSGHISQTSFATVSTAALPHIAATLTSRLDATEQCVIPAHARALGAVGRAGRARRGL